MTPVGRIHVVPGVLFWHENVKVAVIPNVKVSLVGFQEFFLFWLAGIQNWNKPLSHSFLSYLLKTLCSKKYVFNKTNYF